MAFTLYRGAYKTAPRVSVKVGKSTDTFPTGLENGAEYDCIDNGKVYRYDADNNKWYEGVSSECR